ncbi:MAG: hypothetical protein ACTSWN_13610 [Promethearchaeota archaeon]
MLDLVDRPVPNEWLIWPGNLSYIQYLQDYLLFRNSNLGVICRNVFFKVQTVHDLAGYRIENTRVIILFARMLE